MIVSAGFVLRFDAVSLLVSVLPAAGGHFRAPAAGVFVPGAGRSHHAAADRRKGVENLPVFPLIPQFSSSRPATPPWSPPRHVHRCAPRRVTWSATEVRVRSRRSPC